MKQIWGDGYVFIGDRDLSPLYCGKVMSFLWIDRAGQEKLGTWMRGLQLSGCHCEGDI